MVLDESLIQPATQHLLAANLRRLRIARHLSLSELARATGISKATLSGIESGSSNPTVVTLDSIAAALRVTLGELLAELPPPAVRVLRAGDADRRPSEGGALRALERFVAGSGEQVALGELALGAGHRGEYPARGTGARVGLFVIAGRLVAGPDERSTELTAGDYITFPADVPFVLETGRQEARVLMAELRP
jgi:transcriptional regulator with XRE-family HTH domain